MSEKHSKHFKNTACYFVLFSFEGTQSHAVLLKKEQLKGLNALHNEKPKSIDQDLRNICMYIYSIRTNIIYLTIQFQLKQKDNNVKVEYQFTALIGSLKSRHGR